MTATLQEAIAAIRAGDPERAQLLTAEVIQGNPDDPQGWYLLSQLVDSDARRAAYLRKALALEPTHERARVELDALSLDWFGTPPTAVAPPDEAEEEEDTAGWARETFTAEAKESSEPLATSVAPESAWAAAAEAPQLEVESGAKSAPQESPLVAPAMEPVTVLEPGAAAPTSVTTAPARPPAAQASRVQMRQPAARSSSSNSALTILLGLLMVLTLVVLGFLFYLLFVA